MARDEAGPRGAPDMNGGFRPVAGLEDSDITQYQ